MCFIQQSPCIVGVQQETRGQTGARRNWTETKLAWMEGERGRDELRATLVCWYPFGVMEEPANCRTPNPPLLWNPHTLFTRTHAGNGMETLHLSTDPPPLISILFSFQNVLSSPTDTHGPEQWDAFAQLCRFRHLLFITWAPFPSARSVRLWLWSHPIGQKQWVKACFHSSILHSVKMLKTAVEGSWPPFHWPGPNEGKKIPKSCNWRQPFRSSNPIHGSIQESQLKYNF